MNFEKKYRIALVDDDPASLSSLELLLETAFGFVEICGSASNVKEAVELIERAEPDVVFMDVELPDGTGFDVLEKCRYKDYKVIFVSAYEKYAISAFEFSAIHYLLKPIDEERASEVFERLGKLSINDRQVEIFRESLKSDISKIAFPTEDKLCIFELKDIIRFESDNNYTTIYSITDKPLLISKHIKKIEELLKDYGFYRIHRSHIINSRFIKEIVRTKSPQIILVNGEIIPLSENRKSEFYLGLGKQFITVK